MLLGYQRRGSVIGSRRVDNRHDHGENELLVEAKREIRSDGLLRTCGEDWGNRKEDWRYEILEGKRVWVLQDGGLTAASSCVQGLKN